MDEHQKFCIEEARYHLNRANELLTDGLQDPKKYHDEAREFYGILTKMFPLMILMQQCGGPQPLGSETGDNLSDTLSSTQSDEDSFVPVSPPHRSES
jgi:hypothetical protein